MEIKQKEFPRGQLNPTILSTLVDRDKYGYEIIEEIKNKTGIEVKQPSLYSSLKRMEGQKYISSYWQDSDIGGRRHYYCLTAIGKEFLEKNPVNSSIFLSEYKQEVKQDNFNSENIDTLKKDYILEANEDAINEVTPLIESSFIEKVIADKESEDTSFQNKDIEEFEQELRKNIDVIENKIKENLEDINYSQNISQALKNEESNLIKDSQETSSSAFIQQENNVFQASRIDEKEAIKQEERIEKEAEQYDLFDKITPVLAENNVTRIKSLHKKTSSDPHQLKYISEEELISEYEKIRNKRLGITSNEKAQASSMISESQNSFSEKNQDNIWMSRNNYMNGQNKNSLVKTFESKTTENEHSSESVSSNLVMDNYNESHNNFGNLIRAEKNENYNESYLENNQNDFAISNVYIARKSKEKDVNEQEFIPYFNKQTEEIVKEGNSPASLNIESNNYSSYLDKNQYLQEKSPIQKEVVKYNYQESIAKLESKFQERTLNKKGIRPETQFDKSVGNSYERIENQSPTFNSFKSLQAYFNSRGIGSLIYNKKDKSANEYIDSALIRFIRGISFSIFSIVLAFAFYFGIQSNSIGKITYIILPILAVGLSILYGLNYYKNKSKIVFASQQKTTIAPVILPMVAVCAILIILGINLAAGFRSGRTLLYFPILIYPICLAIEIALITPLNLLIKRSVLIYRQSYSKKGRN